MVRPLRIQYPGAFYHLTNRGNEKKAIFKDDIDRSEFLTILAASIDIYGIVMHSFVLMDNHWHFLVQTPLANLSEFMRHFNITYTSHYNRRHKRVGHLYQGRYKSIVVDEDSYLSMVSRYIHLNPVRTAGKKRTSAKSRCHYLWDYQWSSLPGYIKTKSKLDFVKYSTVLAEYGNNRESAEEAYKKQIIKDIDIGLAIHDEVISQSILGGDDFVSRIKESFIDARQDRERPAIRKIHQYLSINKALEVIEQEMETTDLLKSKGTTMQIVMTALYNYTGLNNRELGELFGVDYSTVSQGRKRLQVKAGKDVKISTLINRIAKEMSNIKI